MDQNALSRAQEAYGKLRAKWLETLRGDHPNAIWVQINQMVWDEVWFKTIVRLREITDHPEINPYIWDMFITGYGIKQSLAIRRLTDTDKNTASLARLVGDIRNNRHLLTREVMVGFDGTPLDVESLKKKLYDTMTYDEAGNLNSDSHLALQRWLDADDSHKAFDRLRLQPLDAPRKAKDVVDDSVFQRLEAALSTDAIRRVRARCDHYLAHADYRDFVSEVEGPTYNDLYDSLASLAKVRHFLQGNFLNYTSGPIVAVPQFNHLRDLAKPLVPDLPAEEYREAWDAVEDEVEGWVTIEDVRKFAVHPD